ncbi:carboxylesterase type B [Diaporthe sp. PMI_573]|nr:carboxylesterase type B [Diaporthaceae sp. PMI_573]
MLTMLAYTVLFILGAAALPSPYAHFASLAHVNEASRTVDLGYGRYRGWYNESANLVIFKGIRYAQSPAGKLRWQPPRAPEANKDSLIKADTWPAQCPQSPGASGTYTVADNDESSEDCLFVVAPAAPQMEPALPVLVWIHGGGYGQGSGAYDLSPLITNNNNSFIVVTLQYRLGAFGFLSSDEVYRKGVPNAGLLDQQLALQWVQQYIYLFGWDRTRVTIFGESAGGGSVMLHDLAYGGTLGTSLFRNSISGSPFLPFQYGYKDWQPSQAYYAFATAAGCDTKNAYLRNGSKPIFDCLVEADSATLMNASATVSQSGSPSTWAFLPVTDGKIIQNLPSKQLAQGNVNGRNHLAGHNALEGAAFVPWNITTISDLVEYLQVTFPMLSNNDIAKVLLYYPMNNGSVNQDDLTRATAGDSGPTNLDQSTAATGQMQRAIAIYGETTFICPSYWLAEAYSDNVNGGKSWKYQFSIPNAYHGADGAGYTSWPYSGSYYSPDYILAFMHMLGNFIVDDNPSISNTLANGLSTGNTSFNPASEWPNYSIYAPYLLDFNTTCPSTKIIGDLPYCTGPEQMNTFRLADAYTWEGGRGFRCDFWKSLSELVLE